MTTVLDSFWKRVEHTETCWLWRGYIERNGYGSLSTRIRPTPSGTKLAHRVAYELIVGPIPEGHHLDHLCRVKHCVNPAHLEPVLPQVNVSRGLHGVLRTHCLYGHELTPENTQYDRKRNCRRCRICARRWDRDAKMKARAKASGVTHT